MFDTSLQTVMESGGCEGFVLPVVDPVNTQALFEQARVRLAEACGSPPDGLVLLDSGHRVVASDALGTGLLGPDPRSILRAQVFSLFERGSHKALQAALAKAKSPALAQATTQAGTVVSWATVKLEDFDALGLWFSQARPAAEPVGLSTRLLQLNNELALCTDLAQVAAKLGMLAEGSTGTSGFVFVRQDHELVALAVWPQTAALVNLLRVSIDCSQAAMFGQSVFSDRGTPLEPYLAESASLWVVPVSVYGRLVCLVGLTSDRASAETFGSLIGPHLARISRQA